MRPQLGFLISAALVASCQPQPASQPPADPGTQISGTAAVDIALAVTNVRVFDGAQVQEQQTVMVDTNGLIVAVGPVAEVDVPAGAQQLDGTGHTLLPGLIDAHTHVHAAQNLRQALIFGVTTELDMFANPSMVARIKKKQARGKGHDIADLRSAGTLVTAPGGHGTEYGTKIPTITQASEAEKFVAARIAEGSDYIKVVFDDGSGYGADIPTLGPDTLAAVVKAAHKQARQAVVHIGSQAQAITALDAGADGLAHIFMDSPATPAFLDLAKRGGFITDTLAVTAAMCDPARHEDLVTDPELGQFLTPLEA
ncbi:MAG: amidohydrolase family protein, partial [Nannocystaceae bacterium]